VYTYLVFFPASKLGKNVITQSEIETEKIHDEIVRGIVPPGTHLQETPLSNRLAMSRTPIRTALNSLAQEGRLEYIAKRGYWVNKLTLGEIVDAYNVRATLEGMACRFAAEKGLDLGTQKKLARCIDEGAAITKKIGYKDFDQPAWRRKNNRFYLAIVATRW
jgi:GntR family transcriptional regulator of vanillate catabolism